LAQNEFALSTNPFGDQPKRLMETVDMDPEQKARIINDMSEYLKY